MNISCSRLAAWLLALSSTAMNAPAASGSFSLRLSLFDPTTNAQAFSQQGHSVAVDGNFVVVGAPGDDTGGQDSGVVTVYHAASGARMHVLTNPHPATMGRFGSAVAVSGTRVVVGSHLEVAGSAYVYDLAGATPTAPVLTLTNPTPVAGEGFGWSVAMAGTRVLVGTPYGRVGPIQAGNAYVFDLAGVSPRVPVLSLTNPSPVDADNFGFAVALSGQRIVIGTTGYDTLEATNSGRAYVYDLAAATPTAPVLTLTNPSPTEYASFGRSVAVTGTTVAVGAPGTDFFGAGFGRVYVYDLASATPTGPSLALSNTAPAADDRFGSSVALFGTRLVIGAAGTSQGAANAGIALVYDLAGATPAAPLLLPNPGPASQDFFGFAVAISGTRVVVGSPGEDVRAADRDVAYLYDLAGAMPGVPVATLSNASPAAEDIFGAAVAVSGRRLVVGAPYDDTAAIDAGIVYVYDLSNPATLVPVLTLTNPTPAVFGNFGYAVAISGPLVVVGLIYEDDGPTYAGTAYVYDLDRAMAAVPVVKLTNPRPREADYFGAAVAISGTRVVIGAPNDSSGAFNAGRAYLYDLAGATPALSVLTLVNPSPAAEDYFGHDVDVSGTRVVVGAFGDDAGAPNAGIAHVYDLTGLTPATPLVTLTNPAPVADEWFGVAVAISGTRVAVGAYGDRSAGFYVGSAYVYDLAGATPAIPALTLTNPSPAPSDCFGYSVALAGTHVVVGAVLDGTAGTNAGSAYVYDLAGATPAVPVATLTNPHPRSGDQFAWAVEMDGTTLVVSAPYDDTNVPDRGAAYVFALRPALSLVPAAPGFATLSWTPANSPGFVLQYSDSLSPPNWVNAPSGPLNPVTVSTTTAARFYRLAQP